MNQTIPYKPLKRSELGKGQGPIFNHIDENKYTCNPNLTVEKLKEFTETYQTYSESEKGMREVACSKVQYPLMFCDIQSNELFVGRVKYPAIGFAPQAYVYFGYYMEERMLDELKQDPTLSASKLQVIEELRAFWKTENDAFKTRQAYSPKMQQILDTDDWINHPIVGAPLYRMSGTHCDFDKLVRLGVPGLKAEIESKLKTSSLSQKAIDLYKAMLAALDLFIELLNYYADMAHQQQEGANNVRKKELASIENCLRNLTVSKPKSFREGIQLVFLYANIAGSYNYGRTDEYLGDLFVSDLESGNISEEEAITLLNNWWYLMDAKGNIWDCRVVTGGLGRRNETNANRLALAIMESCKRTKGIVPQLTLRFYKEQDKALYNKALDVIATGNPYPMLYNDEVNIPSVANAFKITNEEAINYIPFGCGEYVIYHKSTGTPSGVINLLQALLLTLNRGIHPVTNQIYGLPESDMESFESFEGLFNSYKKQVAYYVEQLAFQEKLEYDIAAQSANYLYFSMLYDDCIEQGKAIFEGGVRYLGGTLETYGNTNTADSLTAIKNLVYTKKLFSLEKLKNILKANFNTYEKERRLMLDAPKYGNDNEEADTMKVAIDEHVGHTARNMAEKVGLHSYLIVNINNNANSTMGMHTTASPDGRKAYTYMANANSATGGADKTGLTAYLNSIVKPKTNIHAGAVQNLKLSKDLLTSHRGKTEILLNTYFNNGGAQCMINCLGKEDLQNAMKSPEKYSNLIVRVGGFSARFVELDKETQLEILNRTLY